MRCCCIPVFLYRTGIKKREDYSSRSSVVKVIRNFLEFGSVNSEKVSSKRRSDEDLEKVSSSLEENLPQAADPYWLLKP